MAIQIKKPCSANWNTMSNEQQHKFCAQCNKTVFDFSQKSASEIEAILANSTHKVCGRVLRKNLTRRPSFWATIAASFLVVKLGLANQLTTTNLTLNKPKINLLQHSIVLKGTVINKETNEPISFAKLTIKNSTISTTTNQEGEYLLNLPDTFLNKTIQLEAYFIGFEKQTIELQLNESTPRIINFLLAGEVFIGDVVIIKKKKWWQFF